MVDICRVAGPLPQRAKAARNEEGLGRMVVLAVAGQEATKAWPTHGL